MPKHTQIAAEPAPHTWDMEHWPPGVWPHTEGRARYVIRAHKDQLFLAGAMTRVGRELVFFGAAYTKWLQSNSPNVRSYVPNALPKPSTTGS